MPNESVVTVDVSIKTSGWRFWSFAVVALLSSRIGKVRLLCGRIEKKLDTFGIKLLSPNVKVGPIKKENA